MKTKFEPYKSDLSVHVLRAVGFFTAAAILSTGVYYNYYISVTKWLIPVALLLPFITVFVIDKDDNDISKTLICVIVDLLFFGFVINITNHNLITTATLLLIAITNVSLFGSLHTWLYSFLALVTGWASSTAIFSLYVQLKTPLPLIVVSIAAQFIYFGLLSYHFGKYYRKLIITQHALEQKQVEQKAIASRLSVYLAPQVWGSIFANKQATNLEPQRKRLTIFFSDVENFTEFTEELQPEALTELLNGYLTEMSKVAHRYGGTIDKFIGDAIVIFFGDPNSRGAKEDAIACVSMAIEMRKKMKVFRKQLRQRGFTKTLHIRMGIHTGYTTIGNFGAETRMDHTIVGKEVNLASRLESNAARDEICISETTYELIKEPIICRSQGTMTAKGFSKPIKVYEVVDFRRDLGESHSFIEHERDGFAMYLDINTVRTEPNGAKKVLELLDKSISQLKSKTGL